MHWNVTYAKCKVLSKVRSATTTEKNKLKYQFIYNFSSLRHFLNQIIIKYLFKFCFIRRICTLHCNLMSDLETWSVFCTNTHITLLYWTLHKKCNYNKFSRQHTHCDGSLALTIHQYVLSLFVMITKQGPCNGFGIYFNQSFWSYFIILRGLWVKDYSKGK